MSLSTVENAVRGAFETVVTDISKKVTEIRPHLEELATMAAKAEQSPLVQAALSVVLPPALEQQLTNIILEFDKTVNGMQAPAAPAAPSAPAAPVATGPVTTAPVTPVPSA